MADPTPFEVAINKLIELGFYDFFFPFIITSAIMYALFRKSGILGSSNIINAIVSLSIGMLVFGFPSIVGVTIGEELSTFFTQATVWILILVMAGVIAAVFYPSLGEALGGIAKSRTFLFIMLAVAIAIFVTSGLTTVFLDPSDPLETGEERDTPGTPTDIIIVVAALIIFMILLIIAAVIMARAGGVR